MPAVLKGQNRICGKVYFFRDESCGRRGRGGAEQRAFFWECSQFICRGALTKDGLSRSSSFQFAFTYDLQRQSPLWLCFTAEQRLPQRCSAPVNCPEASVPCWNSRPSEFWSGSGTRRATALGVGKRVCQAINLLRSLVEIDGQSYPAHHPLLSLCSFPTGDTLTSEWESF